MNKHYFSHQQSPEDNRWCSKCGKYFTHPNHYHSTECKCKICQHKQFTEYSSGIIVNLMEG